MMIMMMTMSDCIQSQTPGCSPYQLENLESGRCHICGIECSDLRAAVVFNSGARQVLVQW